MTSVKFGAAVLCVVAALGLTGCAKVTEVKAPLPKAGPACRTTGTVQAAPAATITAAVQPFLESGEKVRIDRKLPGTATVQLTNATGKVVTATITLVLTGKGWAPTTVVRC